MLLGSGDALLKSPDAVVEIDQGHAVGHHAGALRVPPYKFLSALLRGLLESGRIRSTWCRRRPELVSPERDLLQLQHTNRTEHEHHESGDGYQQRPAGRHENPLDPGSRSTLPVLSHVRSQHRSPAPRSELYDLAVKIWTERPAKTDAEAVVCHYFDLLRAGKLPEAEQLVDHTSLRHVLKSLWTGSAGADATEDEVSRGIAADAWEQDLSWLSELHLGDFNWGHTDIQFYVEITHHARTIDVSLGFWVKPTDAGWVVSGPSTLW